MEQLHLLDTSWYLDGSHSFVENERMRLQVTFPELIFHDGKSDIALSLFLHNSYNGSEGVRMIFGQVLSQFYGKHTSGLNLDHLKENIEATYDKIPAIKHRIEQMQNTKVSKDLRQSIENKLGKGVIKYINEQEAEFKKAESQWIIYNMITYYISHIVKQRMRAAYQFETSKVFDLYPKK